MTLHGNGGMHMPSCAGAALLHAKLCAGDKQVAWHPTKLPGSMPRVDHVARERDARAVPVLSLQRDTAIAHHGAAATRPHPLHALLRGRAQQPHQLLCRRPRVRVVVQAPRNEAGHRLRALLRHPSRARDARRTEWKASDQEAASSTIGKCEAGRVRCVIRMSNRPPASLCKTILIGVAKGVAHTRQRPLLSTQDAKCLTCRAPRTRHCSNHSMNPRSSYAGGKATPRSTGHVPDVPQVADSWGLRRAQLPEDDAHGVDVHLRGKGLVDQKLRRLRGRSGLASRQRHGPAGPDHGVLPVDMLVYCVCTADQSPIRRRACGGIDCWCVHGQQHGPDKTRATATQHTMAA